MEKGKYRQQRAYHLPADHDKGQKYKSEIIVVRVWTLQTHPLQY